MKLPPPVPSTQYENLDDPFIHMDAGMPLQLKRSFDIFPEKIILYATLKKTFHVLKTIPKILVNEENDPKKGPDLSSQSVFHPSLDKPSDKPLDTVSDKPPEKMLDKSSQIPLEPVVKKEVNLERYKNRKILKSVGIQPILKGSYVVINEKIIPIQESLFRPVLKKEFLYTQEFDCLSENINQLSKQTLQEIHPLGGNDHPSLEKICQMFFSFRHAEDETLFFEYPGNAIKDKALENGYEEEKMISLAEIIQRGYISLSVALEDEIHPYTSVSYVSYEKESLTIHFIRKEQL